MKRAEKLKVLERFLQGKNGVLQEMYREQRKKAMPFLEVFGFVKIPHCSPLLLNLSVMPSESIINRKKDDYIPLKGCLRRFDEIDAKKQPCYSYSAIGSIDIEDERYEAVPLNAIQIRNRDYSNRYLKGGTVADLRRYFYQSASSFDLYPLFLLSFESDLPRYDWPLRHKELY
ncbi:hypothetical protein [Larkinella terrae]|uniref:Uncharacterized protein n=1 Tax=Larkinella terrae TaxID=2025311 RepID=A0A7K0EDZ5_9BACT|nr:hypothetical protein [Larkinella terrae]MRS59801.1 hypothetical protein [Larkinella terrae]